MKHPLLFQWSVSTLFGWGIYGLNLLAHWQKIAGTAAYCNGTLHLESLGGMDPLSLRGLAPLLVESDRFAKELKTIPPDRQSPFAGVVLNAFGNRFSGSPHPSQGGLTGLATCGVIFFEDTLLPDVQTICNEYTLIITGSTWCEEVLRAHGVTNVATVIQGIDPSHFHPAARANFLADRFIVFSGGKLERRKGQDLVVLAFREFAARHPEALLVTAWHSPWPASALTINVNPQVAPVALNPQGKVDVTNWVQANGIPPHQFMDLGSVPNHNMARVLREMDVAVFPNRCEGGTNLVAMECMACGIPSLVSNNSGHKDLVNTGCTYTLNRQSPVVMPGTGTDGWGESDVEEIVHNLEHVWQHRQEARARGLAGAQAMASWSWQQQIQKLHDTLAPLLP